MNRLSGRWKDPARSGRRVISEEGAVTFCGVGIVTILPVYDDIMSQ